MVPDGYYYAIPLLLAAFLLGWLATPLWAIPALLLAAFFLWFFRDPERAVPSAEGAIVSPADGKVTDVSRVQLNGRTWQRISIFLNVFNVHVNRTPISGVIREVRYQRGRFVNAMSASSAEENEQNIVTVEGEGQTVIFKQIAGLIARRIVTYSKVGDKAKQGDRMGIIRFGSRVDVFLPPGTKVRAKLGDATVAGVTILGELP